MPSNKIIGTLVPLSALWSSSSSTSTFETGELFLDWLSKTRQNAWQMLPLHETQLESGSTTKHVPSPYKGYGIGLSPRYLPSSHSTIFPTEKEKEIFISAHNEWLTDYALFCALRDYYGTDDWRKWEIEIRERKKRSLEMWKKKLKEKIEEYITQQWRLHESYIRFKGKAKNLGIMIIGDLPHFPSVQSPLVWANQHVFRLARGGEMQFVSGVPNYTTEYFGRQLWGHPLYNWRGRRQKEKVVAFWKMRLTYLAKIYDMVRFDYARGFFEHGALDSINTENDRFVKGPGASVFEELVRFSSQRGLAIFAEDTGIHLALLRKSMQKIHVPGIKILRFGFNDKRGKISKWYARIADYPTNSVAYTTTHDTEPLLLYLKKLNGQQKQRLAQESGVQYSADDKTLTVRFRQAVIDSPSKIVIIPIQDWFVTEDRINIPGTEKEVDDTNWSYRIPSPLEHLEEPVYT